MGLQQTIGAAIDSVFIALADLVQVGELAGKVTQSFNFQSKQLTSNDYSFTVKFLELTSTVLDGGSVKKELLFRAKDLDPSLYSAVTYNGKTFRFEEVMQYEGALVITVRSA